MGDTYQDPTDHFRTTDQHAGEWMIDVYQWPGFSVLGVGIFALVGLDATLAYRHLEWMVTLVLIAAIAIPAGLVLIRREHRRVRRIERCWHAEHPDAPMQEATRTPARWQSSAMRHR